MFVLDWPLKRPFFSRGYHSHTQTGRGRRTASPGASQRAFLSNAKAFGRLHPSLSRSLPAFFSLLTLQLTKQLGTRQIRCRILRVNCRQDAYVHAGRALQGAAAG
jgi:hypothetical protein